MAHMHLLSLLFEKPTFRGLGECGPGLKGFPEVARTAREILGSFECFYHHDRGEVSPRFLRVFSPNPKNLRCLSTLAMGNLCKNRN